MALFAIPAFVVVGQNAIDTQQLPVKEAERFYWLIMCGAEAAKWLFRLGSRTHRVIDHLVDRRKQSCHALFVDSLGLLRRGRDVWDVLWDESHLSILANGQTLTLKARIRRRLDMKFDRVPIVAIQRALFLKLVLHEIGSRGRFLRRSCHLLAVFPLRVLETHEVFKELALIRH